MSQRAWKIEERRAHTDGEAAREKEEGLKNASMADYVRCTENTVEWVTSTWLVRPYRQAIRDTVAIICKACVARATGGDLSNLILLFKLNIVIQTIIKYIIAYNV